MAKLRHDCCGGNNCYLTRYHADISDFDEDLPGTCEYTDVDAFVEYKHHYLVTEFKTEIGDRTEAHWLTGALRKQNGQLTALERLSTDLPKSTIWLVEGDAPNRQCTRMRECISGVWSIWDYVDWIELKRRHGDWYPKIEQEERARLAEFRASRDNGYRG